MQNPRVLALDVLKKMHKSGQYSNIAVDTALSRSDLEGADRGLFTALVMGVTERRITLDYVIDSLAADTSKIDIDVRLILRLGLYQLMFTDKIPEYAAINETVDMTPRRAKGFVNAILRSYQRKKNSIKYPDAEISPVENLSVRYSYPIELSQRFLNLFGYERTCKIFDSFNQTPPMTLRINTLKISREEYASILDGAGVSYTLTENAPNGIKVFGVSYFDLPHSSDGYFFVQDEASQICVEALGVKAGDRFIDCCACPGSKSFGAAINMQNMGEMLSCDLHKSKLSLIESGAERLGINIITTRAQDARKRDPNLVDSADVLLCDAPCSGLGVMAKKPEIRYKDLSESDKLPAIQSDILENVSAYVKSGGVLVYSTCTLLEQENGEVVKKFLDVHPEYEAENFQVGNIASVDGMLTLTPDVHGTDGFFVAKMRKTK